MLIINLLSFHCIFFSGCSRWLGQGKFEEDIILGCSDSNYALLERI